MKRLMVIASFFMMTSYQMYAFTGTGSITNNSNTPVVVVFYTNNYAPATATRSAQGRYGIQGTPIPAGQNYNFPSSDITSVDIFYGNGTLPPLHASVNTNNSYTINPGSQWTVTQN
ncbi:MAG: hypothetical protein JO129_04115 [Candidatus Dependentiae bacterium]|nr:hypothetical protein [Candidatus Dependentiae bacterium]